MVAAVTALSLSPLVLPNTDTGQRTGAHAFAKVNYDPHNFTTGEFEEENGVKCAPEGEGSGDPGLSLMKNRDKPPSKPFKTMTVAGIIDQDLPNTSGWEIVYKKSKRADWSDENRAGVAKLEQLGVTVQGYFLNAVAESGEMCNCGSTEFVDNHTWLVDNEPDAATKKDLMALRDEALVAEISPRLHGSNADQHPNYNYSVINKIALSHKRVKVSGWLTWDQEHGAQIGKTRGTLWEIHPILNIKVEVSAGKWKELDALDPVQDLTSKVPS